GLVAADGIELADTRSLETGAAAEAEAHLGVIRQNLFGRDLRTNEGVAAKVEVIASSDAGDCFLFALIPDHTAARFNAGLVGESRRSNRQRSQDRDQNLTHIQLLRTNHSRIGQGPASDRRLARK